MIYLLYGDDVTRALATLGRFRARFRREVPSVWRQFDCEEVSDQEQFYNELGAPSLFGSKDFLIIKHASIAPEDAHEIFESLIHQWANDDSVVIFFERGVPTKNKIFDLLLKNKKTKSEEFKVKSAPIVSGAVSDRDLFIVGDLWGRREKVSAVVKYEELLRNGYSADDILRTVLWHARNVCLAAVGKTNEMKPFVANKALQQARNFSGNSLEHAFTTLVGLDNKYKKETLETGLLHFLLTH
ncbi:MAG: hypothetical protein AAB482_01220 [Patescibacteria group bacterium]